MSGRLDLLGVIGTWIAAVLAFIALVGLVAPWLLLKATFSDRNRTLNAIRDVNQDFITKSIGFSREIRFSAGSKFRTSDQLQPEARRALQSDTQSKYGY